jgi:hypothetical protein
VRRCTAAVLLLMLTSALVACREADVGLEPISPGPGTTSSPEQPIPLDIEGPERAVLLTFADVAPGEAVTSVDNTGELAVLVDVASHGGGGLRGARGPNGGAVRMPRWSAGAPGFAIARLRSAATDDVLSPGERAFGFGADFRLDERSTGSDADDGDNLIQRGLFEGAAQYKVQVDAGRLSCRVAGLAGEVIVKADQRVRPGQWYRVRCFRYDDTVTLAVAELGRGGVRGEWTTTDDSAPIGTVVMPKGTPLSVGGKLATDGSIYPASTDQFNGVVDRVMYRLLS